MILCTIDNNVAIPSTTDKIKVTYENQFINDSGSYTYDVSFPMQIHENQVVFKNVHRFDVNKQLPDFEDCKLYADNRLIISGKGTVTSITNDTVKLQIVGGKSRIKYNSKFESHYIDEIDYPTVVITKGIEKSAYAQLGLTEVSCDINPQMLMVDLTNNNFVGQPGVAAFNPINDEGNNDALRNNLVYYSVSKLTVNGVRWPSGYHVYMYNLAIQPNLMYVVKKVLEYEGYTLIRNDFDVDPWNRLLIANAMQSVKIKDALPHWSVYTFLEELRKLFNASIIFDEITHTVQILSANELTNNDAVSYECADEFTSEYDEDGLSNLATSNVEYAFDDSVHHDWTEFIYQSVLKQYEVVEFKTMDLMVATARRMSTKERRCTIFKVGTNFYVWAMLPADGNPDNENLTEQRTQCGYFNPIIRDMESEDYVDLKICPVAIFKRRKWDENTKSWIKLIDKYRNPWIFVPSVTNDKQNSLDEMEADDNGEYYTSVQDAMESGVDEESVSQEDDISMPVMFQGLDVINIDDYKVTAFNGRVDNEEDVHKRFPITFTDYRMHPEWSGTRESASLTLDAMPYNGITSIRSMDDVLNIDKHNLITYNFMTKDLPDPTNIYLLRNKRYICQKVEVELDKGTIDELKKGYFYEIL